MPHRTVLTTIAELPCSVPAGGEGYTPASISLLNAAGDSRTSKNADRQEILDLTNARGSPRGTLGVVALGP